MKKKARNIPALFGSAILLLMLASGMAIADEKIGTLVFNAMKKIQETHEGYLSDVGKIKAERSAAVKEREAAKKQFKTAKGGSLDKREFHARFSFAQAKVYRALHDEAKLTNQVAAKQLATLGRLSDSISGGETDMSAEKAMDVVAATNPFLEDGKALLMSLSEYRDMITDPVINSKLNAAYDTARMLSNYVSQIEKGTTNRYASQLLLKEKVSELVEQLNALYVQTDLLMAMIRDKTLVLRMINELAAAEMAIYAVADGNKVVAQLSSDIMTPLLEILNDSDEDLNTLIAEAVGSPDAPTERTRSQKWAAGTF